jgi:zinc transport system ATP-binding protein
VTLDAVAVVDDVQFAYRADPVLTGVSLELCRGEFVALVGPNGSGKSTLLRVLVGSLTPDDGTVRLFGEDPRHLRDRWRLGYVPQRPTLADGVAATVHDVVAAGRLARSGWARRRGREDRAVIDHALEAVGLADRRDARVRDLSGGQQQRAFIARAMAGEPELLVLDEPVAGVDAESQRAFRDSLLDLVHHHGASVLLVSHELGAVADALDRVIVLKQRVLFDGTPTELDERGISLGVHDTDLPMWLEGVGPSAQLGHLAVHRHTDHDPAIDGEVR